MSSDHIDKNKVLGTLGTEVRVAMRSIKIFHLEKSDADTDSSFLVMTSPQEVVMSPEGDEIPSSNHNVHILSELFWLHQVILTLG